MNSLHIHNVCEIWENNCNCSLKKEALQKNILHEVQFSGEERSQNTSIIMIFIILLHLPSYICWLVAGWWLWELNHPDIHRFPERSFVSDAQDWYVLVNPLRIIKNLIPTWSYNLVNLIRRYVYNKDMRRQIHYHTIRYMYPFRVLSLSSTWWCCSFDRYANFRQKTTL